MLNIGLFRGVGKGGGALILLLLLGAWAMHTRIQMGIAWEDSYHHWLISAHWLTTGHYVDPLAGTTAWLPLTHGIYALVLRFTGVYALEALAYSAAGATLITTLVLYRWAGLGVALLFLLNPVTLLSGSLGVTEPWSTLWLLLGLWAWQRKNILESNMWLILAVLTDRGIWPLVVGLALWSWTKDRKLWIPLVVILGSVLLSNSLGSLEATARWAAIDQAGMDPLERIRLLALYSIGPLMGPVFLALWPKQSTEDLPLGPLGISYLALITALVALGILTGSVRYYLVVIPLLLLGSGASHWPMVVAAVIVLPLNIFYFQQWPRWVVLNQPSVLAGSWLQPRSFQPQEQGAPPGIILTRGILYTDSPLVVYQSRWPLNAIRPAIKAFDSQAALGYLVLVGDQRYQGVYPALKKDLLTQPLGDWSQDWTIRYGAKPVRVYAVNPP